MKIFEFSQQGKRSNNEDSLGYNEGLLTVCDGMGGHNYGERASAFVKDAMLHAFDRPQSLGKMEIQQQLNQVQNSLNQLLEKEPELEKMGTTFTGIFITPDVWFAAHIGDSRIYLFRPSEQKLWHTWDHSLVGELMRTHEITLEAGRFHPMSNRISKALIAQKDGKPVSASIVKINELKTGDILLLCSDGIVEAWGDWELVRLFSDNTLTFEQKCENLRRQCDVTSKDNNTAIIAEVETDDSFSYGSDEELEWTTFAEVESDYKQYIKDNAEVEEDAESRVNADFVVKSFEDDEKEGEPIHPSQPIKSSHNPWPFIITILLAAALSLFFLSQHHRADKEGETKPIGTKIIRKDNNQQTTDQLRSSVQNETIKGKKQEGNNSSANKPARSVRLSNNAGPQSVQTSQKVKPQEMVIPQNTKEKIPSVIDSSSYKAQTNGQNTGANIQSEIKQKETENTDNHQ